MLPTVMLGGILVLGQPPAAGPPAAGGGPLTVPVTVAAPPAEPPAAPTPPVVPPERTPFLEAVQGSWLGALLDDNRLKVSGWTDLTETASTDHFTNGPIGFNHRANQFLLQQNWLRVERTVDEKSATPTWGFRSDTILPGADYRYTLPRGLLNRQLTANNGTPDLYGVDPIQFYAEAYLPGVGRGLDVKAGRFFSPYGVESNDTTQNALYSHAYNFIYNPFTHTGVLVTQPVTDAVTVQNGLVTGSDVFVDRAANPTYVGNVRWAPPAGRDTVTFAVIAGKGRYDAARQFSNPEVFDLVYTRKLSSELLYTLDALYSFQTDFPGVGFVNNWGVVQYLTYQFAPTLSGTVRAEVFDDVQGQRTGFRGVYTEVTTGVTYKPLPNLWLRPELRYDHNETSRPFEGKPSLFTATMNVLVRW